jgi:FKBP-type peptidyl-prolyl cis-trans isomerase (trigger factor)
MAGLIKKQSLVDCFFMHTHFTDLEVKKTDAGEAVITGKLTKELLQECRAEALKELNNRSNIPGFRAGHIPEDVLVKNIGEMKVLEEVAEVALGREYGAVLKAASEKEKISPIGRPTVAITKLAPGIPLEFKITVTLEPDFTLRDYKKIAKGVALEAANTEVADKEIDDVVEEIKKRDWKPELKGGEDLREKVKENILHEKEFRNKEKRRLTIIESLVKATEIQVPKLLIDSELDRMIAQFKDDVTRHGMQWENYLKDIKKTEEEIREEWKDKALERAKAELIIAKIAEAEKLEPAPEDLEREAEHLLSHHKDADPLRARIYVYQMMRNEKVLEFLETL